MSEEDKVESAKFLDFSLKGSGSNTLAA